MVKARKINVVDLNEIGTADTTKATHTEPEPIEETTTLPVEVEQPIIIETPKEIEQPIIIEKPKEIEPPSQPVVMKKNDEKATCAFCKKVMSVKALRYSHDKNCKGKQPPSVERTITTRPKSPERTEEPQTPRNSIAQVEEPQLMRAKAKVTKAELRQQRLSNLVSQAF